MRHLTSIAAACGILLTGVSAQRVVVDYDNGTICTPPQAAFPFYTPGVGSAGRTVRCQYWASPSFAGLPNKPMICSKVGLQIAGKEVYSRFEIRAGASKVTQLSTAWRTNLPDQRLQVDLGNKPLPGGVDSQGAPANKWCEFELEYPFYYQPGEGVVVDLITKIAVPGKMSLTCLGDGNGSGTPRVVDSNFTGGPVAPSVRTSGGLKFRLVFEPLGAVPFGMGCAGSGNSVPVLGSSGITKLGSSNFQLKLTKALGNAPTVMLLGSSRSISGGSKLPVEFGSGCALRVSPDLILPLTSAGTGPGNGNVTFPLAIPSSGALLDMVVYSQWAQVDNGSAASIPVTFSNGGAIVLHR